MDNSKDSLKCQVCRKVFKDPVIWPCGLIVCRSHPYYVLSIKCPRCELTHNEPEKSFPSDTKADEMSKLFYKDRNNLRLNKSIKETERLINESEPFVKDPHFYIYEYFSELRNKADLAKEQLIQIIEQRHTDYINQINELETKCKTSAIEIGNKFCNNFEEIKVKFAELNESIKTPDLTNDQTMKKLFTEIEKETQTIEYLINKYKIDLLQSNQCTFKSSLKPIYDLKIKDLNGTNTGTIQYLINDFNTFKELSEVRKSYEWCVIKDTFWKFSHIDIKYYEENYHLKFKIEPRCNDDAGRKYVVYFEIFGIDSNGEKILLNEDPEYIEHDLDFGYNMTANISHDEHKSEKILLQVEIELID